jgi:hypothetical protein
VGSRIIMNPQAVRVLERNGLAPGVRRGPGRISLARPAIGAST